jgi:hypothetical protein
MDAYKHCRLSAVDRAIMNLIGKLNFSPRTRTQVTSARSSGVDIAIMLSVRKDMAPELEEPIPVKITSKCQYLLLSNKMLNNLLPVPDGLEACAVPEPSVFEEEEDAAEELSASADN